MSRIFISYRRDDSAAEAGRIYDYLERTFGEDSVFKDVDDIDAGDDFRERLNNAMEQCQVLLAVIGQDWLEIKDGAGQRRLDNPADWVRLEIETALTRKIRVIPALLDGVAMPRADMLPESLEDLAFLNAARVRHDPDFRKDINRVIGVIRRHFERLEQQTQQAEEQKRRAQAQAEAARRAEAEAQARAERERVEAARKLEVARLAEVALQRQMDRQAEAERSLRERKAAVRMEEKERSEGKVAVQMPVRSSSVVKGGPVANGLLTTVQQSVSRRTWMKALGYSAGGLGVVLAGSALRRVGSDSSDDLAVSIELSTTEFDVATITDIVLGSFETVRKTGEFFRETLGDDVTLDLMKIPSGTFMMGSPDDELERAGDEGPQREVSVPAFFMGKYAITQVQWRAVAALPKVNRDLEESPSRFEGDNLPVERVSWEEAVEFCDRLSANTNRTYRLPSEAEWEYACRAGTTTPFYCGDTITSQLGNYNANSTYNGGPKGEYRERTIEVGSFPANAFGLYDMHGNVWEWCQDHWHSNYEDAPVDGSAWLEDDITISRVRRGGSWVSDPRFCRSAYRFDDSPEYRNNGIGFRVSCAAPRTL